MYIKLVSPQFPTNATVSTLATSIEMSSLDAASLFGVKGLVAVITGGGTGIGLMMAKALEFNGAKVYIIGRRLETLQTAAREAVRLSHSPVKRDKSTYNFTETRQHHPHPRRRDLQRRLATSCRYHHQSRGLYQCPDCKFRHHRPNIAANASQPLDHSIPRFSLGDRRRNIYEDDGSQHLCCAFLRPCFLGTLSRGK